MGNSTRITLPADSEAAVAEVCGIAALLDKNGWKAAAFIAVSVKPGTRGGSNRRSAIERLTAIAFARGINAKGWSEHVIRRHFDAWEAAANDGVVAHAADLNFGERIEVPTDGWAAYYPPMLDNQHSDAEAVQAQAALDGVGVSKAVDIAKNTGAMAAAIKGSPKVAAAATQALIETGDVGALSQATAKAAKNRQVERNRQRVADGLGKARTVEDKPTFKDPTVSAWLKTHGLSDALRAVVTTFPQEWNGLSEAERADEDFVALCDETLDKIEIAVANIRMMIGGGISDTDLHDLLAEGGAR